MSEQRSVLLTILKRLEEDAAFLRAEIAKLDAEPPAEPLPTIREMILMVLRRANPYGQSRAEIAEAIKRDYGCAVSVNSISGTLARMRGIDVMMRGKMWFLRGAR